jgi:Flp pilus assembly protein TadD
MYSRKSLVASVLLIGSIFVTMLPATHAQVLVAQLKSSEEVKQLLEQGRRLVDTGDFNGAISVYQQAASLEPKNATIHSGIGYLYALQGNFSAALASYRRAVNLNPNNSDYQYALGYVTGNLGDNKGAKEAYRRSIQLNRGNLNAYLGLATILLRLGEYENFKWAYEEAIKLDPKNPQAYELRGTLLMKQGKSSEAIGVFRKARELYESQGKRDSVARVEAMLRNLGV